MLQLMILGLAGLLAGAALGAARARAPKALVVTFLTMMGVALGLSIYLLVTDPHN